MSEGEMDDGGRRPTRYWSAPLAGSTRQAPDEPLPPIPDERGTARTIGRYFVVGILVSLGLATAGAVMRGWKNAGPSHTITVPDSVDQYDRLTGNVTERIIAGIRASAANRTGVGEARADEAAVAVYGRNQKTDQRLIFIGFSTAASPEIGRELRSHSASHEADELFRGEGHFSNERDFEPGRFGGVLRCGTGDAGSSASASSMCVWVDGSTVGMVLTAKTAPAALAGTALAFRNAAEH
ncbi:hypothetical protein [Actinoallomurus sp. CA-150999]|uniref:hypothetical protein n=1 Tax=Actinoallomurus sp. CA-150999 TaxID=3239887 RepID=UPI003D8BD02F